MSGHLRKEFHNLNSMGRMVRTILTALDRARITESVLNDLLTMVPCDWAALALLKSNRQGEADSWCVDNTQGESSQRFQFSCTLSSEQIKILEKTVDSIMADSNGRFSSLIAPLAEKGARYFVLMPIRSSQRVIGALTLAYRARPAGFREDLV